MIRNSLDSGPEGWCFHDYHASMVADCTNIFTLGDSGFVWTDHRR